MREPTIDISDAFDADSIYENRRRVYGQCFHCMRPKVDCFCDAIPRIDNRLPILILQHRHERRHPFNTVRITERALADCQVLIGFKTDFRSAALPILPGAGLLYPGEESQLLPSPTLASADSKASPRAAESTLSLNTSPSPRDATLYRMPSSA